MVLDGTGVLLDVEVGVDVLVEVCVELTVMVAVSVALLIAVTVRVDVAVGVRHESELHMPPGDHRELTAEPRTVEIDHEIEPTRRQFQFGIPGVTMHTRNQRIVCEEFRCTLPRQPLYAASRMCFVQGIEHASRPEDVPRCIELDNEDLRSDLVIVVTIAALHALELVRSARAVAHEVAAVGVNDHELDPPVLVVQAFRYAYTTTS